MPLSTRRATIGAGTYIDKVLNTGPVAYWPLNEISGTVAHCLINQTQNGTPNSDVSTWPPGPGIGDGNTALFFDGTNDIINVSTATLIGKWDLGGAQWSMMIWWKVNAVAVWTDGVYRRQCNFRDSANDLLSIYKTDAANTQGHVWWANGNSETSNLSTSSVVWNCTAITRNEVADTIVYYVNGAAFDSDTTIDNWGSATPWDRLVIGGDAAGSQLWHGWLAHCVLWDRPLSAADVANLYAM